MARPKYAENEKTAPTKLQDAFWELLEKTHYSSITVAQVVKVAGLNRNSFYYHFSNMKDLAHAAVLDIVKPEIVAKILKHLNGQGDLSIADEESHKQRIKRFCLIAGQNSTYDLRMMLVDAMEESWCKTAGIDSEKFSEQDKIVSTYLLGGTLAVFAYCADNGLEVPTDEIMRSGLSRRIYDTMLEIAAHQHSIEQAA